MAPTSILFSPPRNPSDVLLRALAEPWFDLDIVPRAIGKLGRDEEGNMQFAGMVRDCDGWDDLLAHAQTEPTQAVHFSSIPAQDDVYVYQWEVDGERRLSAELGYGRLRYFESDDYPVGRYQVALMHALAVAGDVDVCVYSWDYDEELFVALDPAAILERLRRGVLMRRTPAVFLLSTKIIAKADVEAAIAKSDARHLKYFITTSGYHVLSQYAGGW